MAYNKLNTFHWHIVDDHSFPYQSITFPELSENGAYGKRLIYSQNHVIEIIDYARMRGIRVIPEFDSPGHNSALKDSHPEIFTDCGDKLGPLDPIKNETYVFLKALLKEISEVFPEKYLHLGGDQVGGSQSLFYVKISLKFIL